MTASPSPVVQATPTSRARHARFLLSLAAVAVLILGVGVGISFLRRAESARISEKALSSLASDCHALAALEWQAAAERGVSPQLSEKVALINARMQASMLRLSTAKELSSELATVRQRYSAYRVVMAREFDLFRAGRLAEAAALDEEQVDPSFEELLEAIETASSAYDLTYSRIVHAANLAMMVILVFAVGSISIISWGLSVAKLAAAVAAAEEAAVRRSNEALQLEIAERRRAQEESRALHLRTTMVLDAVSDGVIGLDVHGRQTFINPAVTRILGFEAEEMLGRSSHALWYHTRTDDGPDPVAECPILSTYRDGTVQREQRDTFCRKDGSGVQVEYTCLPVRSGGVHVGAVLSFRDITEQVEAEAKRERLLTSLQEALASVKTLSGLLPICAHCKRIRDDDGSWNQLERYVANRTEAKFSHGICPDCLAKHYPGFSLDGKK